MEQLPVEVESLQHQLTEQKISPDNFFAMLLSMFELDASKGFMRTEMIILIIVENARQVLVSPTAFLD